MHPLTSSGSTNCRGAPALENLMDNAATCGAGHPVEVVVRLAVARSLPGIEVLVADHGPGVGRASASRRAGQGVGLPLVRKLAQDNSAGGCGATTAMAAARSSGYGCPSKG